MSTPSPSDIVKTYPDVYAYTLKKEKSERVTIKGIELTIKKYVTTFKTTGIRVSLLDNTGQFFLKFNEYLAQMDSKRPADERAIQMWSFTTLSSLDPGLEVIEDAGFYVYQDHIIFNQEEKSASPIERLIAFIDYYKKKFNIKTYIKEDEFAELDILERDTSDKGINY